MNKRLKKKLQFKRRPGMRPMYAVNYKKWFATLPPLPKESNDEWIARHKLWRAGCRCKRAILKGTFEQPRCEICGAIFNQEVE